MSECLFLEEVLESLTGVVVARRGGRCRIRGIFLDVGGGRGILFYCSAKLVKRAVVAHIFGRDSFRHGLRALELRARIEVAALLAGVKFETAFGTFAVGIEAGGEDCTAVGTSRSSDGTDHARGSGAELIGAAWAAVRRRFAIVGPLFFFVFFRIAISAMAILAIHKRLRPPVPADCQLLHSVICAKGAALTWLVQLDCYTRPLTLSSPEFTLQVCRRSSRRWDIYVCSPLGVRSQAREHRAL